MRFAYGLAVAIDRPTRSFWRCVASLVVATAGIVGCSSGSDSSATSRPDDTVVAARAIDAFGERYAASVSPANQVQIPGSLDIDAVDDELDMDVVLVRSADLNEASWRVISVDDRSDYWVVEMASSDGANYFSGPLFFVVDDSDDLVQVEAEDVGETITTSVS